MTAYKVYNTKMNRTEKYFFNEADAKAFIASNRKERSETRITTAYENGEKNVAYASKGQYKNLLANAKANKKVELITYDDSGWEMMAIEIN